MRTKLFRLLVALALLVVLPAAGGAELPKPKSKTHEVAAVGSFPRFAYDPPDVTIKVGDRVRWVNQSGTEHHVTPYDGPWADESPRHLDPDAKVSVKFTKPGVYRYYCDLQFHGQIVGPACSGQCGSITVQ